MMKTVIDEIRKLRKGAPLAVDTHNSSRYRLVVNEDDGSKTAYYFTTPVYNSGSGRLLDCKFRADKNKAYLTGSNSNITVSDRVVMESSEGYCGIDLGDEPIYILDTEVHFGRCVLFPTTNGVALKCAAGKDGSVSFDVEVGNGELMVRSNDRYFALMAEQFKPFVTFSCIGTLDSSGRITAPCASNMKGLVTRYIRSPCRQWMGRQAIALSKPTFMRASCSRIRPSKAKIRP